MGVYYVHVAHNNYVDVARISGFTRRELENILADNICYFDITADSGECFQVWRKQICEARIKSVPDYRWSSGTDCVQQTVDKVIHNST